MYVTESGLSVMYTRASNKQVERDLRVIDSRLFLDPEWSDQYGVYWTVKFWNGERAPSPVTLIVDWRDLAGAPLELSYAIVEETKRQRATGPVSVERIAAKNRALVEERADKTERAHEELAREEARAIRRLPVIHRSRALAQTRARMRSEGIRLE